MKNLLIVRHAKSSFDFQGLKDFDRPLNDKGNKDAEIMARQLINHEFIPAYIISSGAKRALMTSQIIADVIEYDVAEIEINNTIYNSSCDEVINIIKEASDEHNKLMIMGHNPTFHFLSQILSGENIIKFPECSMFCIRFDIESWTFLVEGTKEFMIFPELFI